MSEISGYLEPIIAQNQLLAYAIVFVATIFLGNLASFTALWLGFKDYNHSYILLFLIITIFLADIIGDLSWYSLGRGLRNTRLGAWFHGRIPKAQNIEAHLQENSRKWIFLSKYIFHSTFAIIFSVGWSKIPFRIFFKNSLIAIGTSVPLIIGITYGLAAGLSLLEAVAFFKNFEVILVVGLLLFLVVNYLVRVGIRKMFDSQ